MSQAVLPSLEILAYLESFKNPRELIAELKSKNKKGWVGSKCMNPLGLLLGEKFPALVFGCSAKIFVADVDANDWKIVLPLPRIAEIVLSRFSAGRLPELEGVPA